MSANDKQLNEYDQASNAGANDLIYGEQNGTSKKFGKAQLLNDHDLVLGVASGDTNLGVLSANYISDNSNVRQSLLDLDETVKSENSNSTIGDAQSISAFNDLILERLSDTPVGQAYDTGEAPAPTSVFSGWRFKLTYSSPFRVIQAKTQSDIANHEVRGYIWDDSLNLVATAVAYVRSSNTDTTLTFIFNKEINQDTLSSQSGFWFGYQSYDNSAVLMAGTSGITGTSGVHNTSVYTQYTINTGSADGWTNVSGSTASFKCWLRLYSLNDLTSAWPTINLNTSRVSHLEETVIVYDSLSEEIAGIFNPGGQRGNPFTGWGANYNLGGVSFNALKIENLKRNATSVELDKWASIQVYVKNDKADSTVLAMSPLIKLDSDALSVESVVFPLMNADLDTVVTLDNSSFSGSQYFIGYLFFNSEGDRAFGGEVLGSISNYGGTSFYSTNDDHTSWASFVGNPSIPFTHLTMVNDQVVIKPAGQQELKERVDSIEAISTVRVVLPDEYQIVVGDTFQLFLKGVVEAIDPYAYHVDVDCSIGNQFPRYYELTAVSGNIGAHTLTVNVYDQDQNIIGTDSTTLRVVAAVQQPSTSKNVMCVGDSLTSGGGWPTEAKRRLAGSGGTPAGLNYGNINFIGSVGTAPTQWVGYGGKTWGWYNEETDPSDLDIWVYATHDKQPADQLSVWRDSGSNDWVLEEIETGRLKFSHSGHTSDMPVAPAALTHVSGATNTGTINYTQTEDDGGNPFWDDVSNGIDFNAFCSRNGFAGIDVVYTLLTWNGLDANRSIPADHASLRAEAEKFLDNLHADYPNAEVKILGIPTPSPLGGLGTNYTAGSGYGDYFGLVRTVMGLNLLYQEIANDSTYSSFVEFVNVSGQFDPDYNYPETTVSVNSRNLATERRQSNGVHPKAEGYYQIADTVYRNFIQNYCQ